MVMDEKKYARGPGEGSAVEEGGGVDRQDEDRLGDVGLPTARLVAPGQGYQWKRRVTGLYAREVASRMVVVGPGRCAVVCDGCCWTMQVRLEKPGDGDRAEAWRVEHLNRVHAFDLMRGRVTMHRADVGMSPIELEKLIAEGRSGRGAVKLVGVDVGERARMRMEGAARLAEGEMISDGV